MDNLEKNRLKEIEAVTPARKAIKEIPIGESMENAAADKKEGSTQNVDANEDKETTVEKESAKNATANADKETTVGKERTVTNMAVENTASAQERKGTSSTKVSLNNDVSLPALLDSTDEDETDKERKHRIKFNHIHVINYVGKKNDRFRMR
jgi:hypothetical protein